MILSLQEKLKMRKLVIVLAVILIGLSNLVGQNSDSAKVWRNAKWGMTEEQVQGAFNGEIRQLSIRVEHETSYSNIFIPRVEILGNNFKVIFLFDSKEKKLIQINLQLIDATQAAVMFDLLEQELIKKYNKPILVNKQELLEETTWKTNNSIISISYLNTHALQALVISYNSIIVSDNL